MKRALVVLIAAILADDASAKPPGWDGCRGAAAGGGALNACMERVSAPCLAAREAEGDGAWLGCLSDAAAAWEDEVGLQTKALQDQGHPAGDSASAARWLAMRSARCRPRDKVAQMMQEVGEAETAAAILRCEMINSIQRADHLAGLEGRSQ
ncbi:MAG: hypothetical protein AAGG06_18615 [Pseudomonadota bacterium]